MKTLSFINPVRDRLKHLALASAVAVGLGAGSAHALTTTTVINLGTAPSYTAFTPSGGAGGLYAQIPAGTLPVGSILRAVSWNVSLQQGDPYLGDLAVYIADSDGSNPVLQVGSVGSPGSPVDGSPPYTAPIKLPWNAGNVYDLGTTASTTLTAGDGVPAIDLGPKAVFLETCYSGGWAGTITLTYDVPEPARIMTFGPAGIVDQTAKTIAWAVPYGTNLATLTPTLTLSSGVCVPASGESPVLDPSNQATYTVTDGATVNHYTLTVTVTPNETTLLWDIDSGVWDFSAPNWKGLASGVTTPYFNGVNAIFDKTSGGTINITAGVSPLSITINADSGTYTFSGLPITSGSLVKSGDGRLTISIENNSYSGGTIINAGRLTMDSLANAALGTGPVTLNGGTLYLYRVHPTNDLIINGGVFLSENGFGNSWNGNITLNANFNCDVPYPCNITGGISGTGGLIKTNDGLLSLSGNNSHTGPTSVTDGTLRFNSLGSVTGGDLSISSGGAKVDLNYSGTKAIASLTLGGVAQTLPGTYGSVASLADFPDDTYFVGSGTVTVVGDSPYTTWANSTFANGALSNKDSASDPDGDGRTNQQEFAFGLDPTTGASVNPISKQIDKTTGVFKYTRTKNSGLTYIYQSSTTIADPWNVFTPDSTASNNATPVEEITITVPSSLLSETKLFLRVKAQ